ncbi:hypothetical protein OJ998_05115 [Solirubrobacter taibaiensis]|nr:hypothetical protein [Solirubrobacter taibaiensis]
MLRTLAALALATAVSAEAPALALADPPAPTPCGLTNGAEVTIDVPAWHAVLLPWKIHPGDVVSLTAEGSMHGGYWLAPWNGPSGLASWRARSDWPLPGVNEYALFGTLSGIQHTQRMPFVVGTRSGCVRYSPAPIDGIRQPAALWLDNNDVWPVDNQGAFRVRVSLRTSRPVVERL